MWSPFGQLWSVKYLNFGPKLPSRTTSHTFLESRHPEVTENVLSPEWSQKKVSAYGLQVIVRVAPGQLKTQEIRKIRNQI